MVKTHIQVWKMFSLWVAVWFCMKDQGHIPILDHGSMQYHWCDCWGWSRETDSFWWSGAVYHSIAPLEMPSKPKQDQQLLYCQQCAVAHAQLAGTLWQWAWLTTPQVRAVLGVLVEVSGSFVVLLGHLSVDSNPFLPFALSSLWAELGARAHPLNAESRSGS